MGLIILQGVLSRPPNGPIKLFKTLADDVALAQ
jgi:hypothetical protein